MIREYKLNTAGQLDLGWKDVEFWLSLFPNLTQADLDNPRLFTPNLESMVEPKKKEQEWEILVISFEDTNHLFIPNGEGRFFHSKHFSENQSGWTQDELLNHKTKEYRIHTVKRLSDGETFSVGDNVTCHSTATKGWDRHPLHYIYAFGLNDDKSLFVCCKSDVPVCGTTYESDAYKSGVFSINQIEKAKQQPPQEEQPPVKDNDVFVWDEDLIGEFAIFYHANIKNINSVEDYYKYLGIFKASKSTPKEEKIRVKHIASQEKSNRLEVFMSCDTALITDEQVKQISKAIDNVLNNYPNPEFGKAAYERLMDTNQEIMELMSKMYTEEQLLQASREAFDAARFAMRQSRDKDGMMFGNYNYKTFEDYLQSLNNK